MRKVFRYLGLTVLILVVLVGLFASYVSISGIPTYKAEPVTLAVTATPERIAKGHKLATMLCRSCHLDPNTGRFSGKRMDEVPQFGAIVSRNITRHKEAGIGSWTDGQLAYLLRTGIKPDGTYLPPYMPKLVHLSDEDLASVIAFLRSDHPWVQADDSRPAESKPSFLTKFLTSTKILKPFPYPTAPIPEPDTANAMAWGRYIAIGQLECFSCHSQDFAKNDYFNPEKSPGFFGGGNELISPDGLKLKSRNITMDEETGIGRWTEEEFIKAVKYGQMPHGAPALRNPMQPYSMLTDNEVRAIYSYLKTVPKIKNKVERAGL